MSHNPNYNPEALGLQMVGLGEDNLSYEFNELTFWRGPDGRVFGAEDSGCSCPTPFDYLESETYEEFAQKAERIPNLEAAERMIKGWNTGYTGQPRTSANAVNECIETLRGWFKEAEHGKD